MAGYQNIENDVIDLLLDNDKGQLLKLYVFLRRFRRINNKTKIIKGCEVTINKNQLDISLNQIAKRLGEPVGTINDRLSNLERLSLISRVNFKNRTTIITVMDKRIQTGISIPDQTPTKNQPNTDQNTNNIVLKNYSINNLSLSENEIFKLKEDFELSENQLKDCLINFSEKKEMKGYKYKKDYLALRNWGVSSYKEKVLNDEKLKFKQNKHNSYISNPINTKTLEERIEDGYDF